MSLRSTGDRAIDFILRQTARPFVVLPNTNPKLISRHIHDVPHDELPVAAVIGWKAHVNVGAPSVPLAFYTCWLAIVTEHDHSSVSAELIISTATSRVYACPRANEIGFSQSSIVPLIAIDNSDECNQADQNS